MKQEEIYLLIGVVVFTVLAALGFMVWKLGDKKRRRRLEELAERNGWRFEATGPHIADPLSCLELFGRGHSRRVSNLMVMGPADHEVRVFDYEYTTGRGRHATMHWHTIVAFDDLPLELPDFQVRPKELLHKIGTAFGYQDIDIENRPDFSSKYVLRGACEEAIRDLFDERRIASIEENGHIGVEGSGRVLIVYSPPFQVALRDFEQFILQAKSIRAAFARQSSRMGRETAAVAASLT